MVKRRVSQSNVQSEHQLAIQGSPTSRWPNHRLRLLFARALERSTHHAIPRGQVVCLGDRAGAADVRWVVDCELLGWRGSGASAPVGRYRGGSGGEAAAVAAARKGWPGVDRVRNGVLLVPHPLRGGRRPSCDHAATRSCGGATDSVLRRRGGASDSGSQGRSSSWTMLSRAQCGATTGVDASGGGCSTLSRLLMCQWSRRGRFHCFQFAYGGRGTIPRIFYATLDSGHFFYELLAWQTLAPVPMRKWSHACVSPR